MTPARSLTLVAAVLAPVAVSAAAFDFFLTPPYLNFAVTQRDDDVDREGLPTLDLIELPVVSGGVDRGRYLLTSTSTVRRPDVERRQVAVTLADQAAAALAALPRPGAPEPVEPVEPAGDDGCGGGPVSAGALQAVTVRG